MHPLQSKEQKQRFWWDAVVVKTVDWYTKYGSAGLPRLPSSPTAAFEPSQPPYEYGQLLTNVCTTNAQILTNFSTRLTHAKLDVPKKVFLVEYRFSIFAIRFPNFSTWELWMKKRIWELHKLSRFSSSRLGIKSGSNSALFHAKQVSWSFSIAPTDHHLSWIFFWMFSALRDSYK